MALLVELVGAPGAGKSTLASVLDGLRVGPIVLRPASDLARPPRAGLPLGLGRRLAPDEDPRDLRAALAARADGWDELLRLVLAGTRDDPRPPSLRLEALGWTWRTFALTALVRAAPAGAFILDEGVLQRVTAALGPAPDTDTAARYGALAPRADLVLHLTADDATLGRRLAAREAARVAARHVGLDPSARLASARADADLLARVADAAAAAGTRVVEIDASDGAEPVSAARAAVRGLLAGATADGTAAAAAGPA